MKKIWFGIGAAVIIVLLLLQTKFNTYLQLDNNGYAIEDKTVKNLLLANPDELVEEDTADLVAFEPLDYIYTRGNSYYLGEDKKTQIDITFPMLVNGGAGVWFIDDSSTLYDVNYDEFTTYKSLQVSKKIAYNPGGSRADADEYLFAGLKNGFFISLDSFTYDYNGKTREVAMNSYINFTKDYFTYCEQDGEQMVYQVARNMSQDAIVTVNGEELTYHQLLLNLHVISDKKEEEDKTPEEEALEVVTPTPEVLEEDTKEETTKDDDIEEEEEKEKKEKEKKDSNKEQDKQKSGGSSGSSSSKGSSSKASGSRGASGSGSSSSGNRGVRPDSARPDKKDDDDSKPHKKPAVGYVKPTVEYLGSQAGVYRLMVDVKVTDPARRLDPLRLVQFEYYKQGDNGEFETNPSYRTYTGGTGRVTAGEGIIMPDTTYRVNVYFSYYDEYNVKQTESVKSDIILTTGSLDSLGGITFKTGTEGGTTYMDIPIYYDNFLKIENVTYEGKGTDSNITLADEAVYGIDSRKFSIKITGADVINAGFSMTSPIDSSTVSLFKRGGIVSFSSASGLESNSHYKYEIIAKDFFDNDVVFNNDSNKGEFYTCKARPQGVITVTQNDIGKIKFKMSVSDREAASIPPLSGESTDRDVYFVVSTKPNRDKSGTVEIWEECQRYIDNDGRVYGSEDVPEGTVHYLYQLESSQYTVADDGSITVNSFETDEITGLDLDENYYAYLIADYDLNNNAGPVYQGEIGNVEFVSAGLSTLGSIYVSVEVSNITAHGANILYTLNESKTNDILQGLVHDVKFDIVASNGDEEEVHSTVAFNDSLNSDWLTMFTGYSYNTEDPPVWTYDAGNVATLSMDDNYFNKSMATEGDPIPYYLNSMTDYKIVPEIKATYNGKKYDMRVILSKSSFKTKKEPAKVDVKDLMFAGGTLKFKVRIDDPDGAITGNSGHVVVMNLYDYGRNLKKSLRIPKNSPVITDPDNIGYIQEVFNGLDPTQKYYMEFIAVEYNEGYSNDTFMSNVVLERIDITQSLNISGTIKLQSLERGLNGNMEAHTKVVITDDALDPLMVNEYPYYVRVEKKTTDASGNENYVEIQNLLIKKTDYSKVDNIITELHSTVVDPNSEYRLTLYINYSSNELVLDTLRFTTEREIVPIANAIEFVEKIKANGANDVKYCITGDIDITEYDKKRAEDPDFAAAHPNTSSRLVSIFNGEIDFQGFKLIKDKLNDDTNIFSNIGPTSKIYNAVFEFSDNTSVRTYDEGLLSSRNYGHIHDIIVNYRGGSGAANQYYGLICRINSASGIIERFVVNNDPAEGSSTFSARNYCGLVCSENYGTIRHGYVYGDDINATTGSAGIGGAIYVGGIAGVQNNLGQMYDVYSLVNIVVSNPGRNANSNARDTTYGAIIGSGAGRIHNMYSCGQSVYNTPYDNKTYDVDSIGPAIGTNVGSSKDVFYWNEAGVDYTASTRQTRIGLESLYDYSWQQGLLGSQFDTQPIEVGYYPHVIMNEELPEQELVPLPGRAAVKLVEIVGTEVKEYSEDGNSAIIEFRLSNTRNATVKAIEIENLTTEIIEDESKGYVESSLDGYTTIYARVSEPTKYVSQYKVKSLSASLGKSTQKITYDPAPIVYVDFYRMIHNADEWYQYVVSKPTENAKLANDIDFTGVAIGRIRVTSAFSGKLDGNKAANGGQVGFALNNITLSDNNVNYTPYVFYTLSGEINDVCVNNITLTRPSKYNNGRAGFIYTLSGVVNNVHMQDVTIKGREYMGAVAGYMSEGAELKNSSANRVTIEYTEPANTNTDGRIGGLVGYANQCHITNCYVRDLDMSVMDIKNCDGAGGIVGYSNVSGIQNVYATGDMVVRGVNVGGIVGYHSASEVNNVINNAVARVNVTSYQDMVGGLVGTLSLSGTLTERNNMTGVAFGNVLCKNTSSESVSYTVGNMGGYRGTFYGADFQLFNGMVNVPKDDNTYGLITYDEAHDPDVYASKLGMTGVYNYSYVEEGYLPHLYYEDSSVELPFQGEDPISLNKVSSNKITISNIYVDTSARTIAFDVVGPEGYTVTDLKIEEGIDPEDPQKTRKIEKLALKRDADNKPEFLLQETIRPNGTARVTVEYKQVSEQKFFLDSYMLEGLSYVGPDNEIGSSDFTADPVRIPLVLYKDIHDIQTWNQFINPDNNYGDYQNYRITADINFGSGENYTTNAKIGRLVGQEGSRKVLSGINLARKKDGISQNLIFRLNSELSNLTFKGCTVNADGRQCAGLIGSSAGEIYNTTFENITINCYSTDAFVGMIGYQIAGCLGKPNETLSSGTVQKNGIDMKGIRINTGNVGSKGNNQYTGGLAGYAKMGTMVTNINAEDFVIIGNGRVGGIIGATGKAYFEDVHGKDFNIQSVKNERVGGIVGSYEAGRTNSTTGAYFVNVSLTGTPTTDADGYTTDSTTVVSFSSSGDTNSNHIGGLIGYSNCYLMGRKYNDASTAYTNTIDGIVVKGLCNYTGGMYGYCQDTRNAVCKNTLVTTFRDTTGLFNRVGGIAGDGVYEILYTTVDNVRINIKNHSYVGLCVGYKSSGTGVLQYNKVENSRIDASEQGQSILYIGGSVGYTYGELRYNTVVNTNVNAEGGDRVGGVVGFLNHNMYRCFYYATPVSSKSPTSSSNYKVYGDTNVGGLAGYQNTGQLYACYSNANVIAEGKYAGGINGYYRNEYTVTQVSGKDSYSYSGAYMVYNYFAGSVTAKDYAGGFIGNLGLVSQINNEKVKDSGGRNATANASNASVSGLPKTGSANEVAYTFRNMCFASYVKTTDGEHAYAFAGNRDGFEGKANYWNCGSSLAQLNEDKAGVDNAYYTFFWDGMKVNDIALSDMTYDNTPDISKNTWLKNHKSYDKRYVPLDVNTGATHWYNRYEKDCNVSLNCRIVSTAQLKTYLPYALVYNNYNNGTPTWKGGYYHVNLSGDVTLAAPYDSSFKNLLPHIRVNNDNAISDYLTQYQVSMNIKLPVPDGSPPLTMAPRRMMAMRPADDFSMTVYTADADKINIEFGSSFITQNENEKYYFAVYCNGTSDSKLVDKHLIDKRVYTYTYDFKSPFYVQYGKANIDECVADGHDADEWYELGYYDTIGDGTGNGAANQNVFAANDILRRVMVYGDKYYYINPQDNTVITGYGAGTDEEGVDPTASVIGGEYINIYSGKGLTKDGSLVDLQSRSAVGAVSTGMSYSEQSKALQHFIYNVNGNSSDVKTYFKHSALTIGDTTTDRTQQVLKSGLNKVDMIDKNLPNVKDAVVIYEKDGKDYLTVLGADSAGLVSDMYNGDDIGAPEDFSPSGIVSMSNNFDTTQPYILVEYSNGSIVGWNYMTGEYLFKNKISNEMSLLDYLGIYMENTRPTIFETYRGVANVAEMAPTADRLYQLVEDNNNRGLVTDNNTDGDTAKSEETVKGLSESLGVKAGEDTALKDPDAVKGTEGLSSTESDGTKKGGKTSTKTDIEAKSVVSSPEGATTEGTSGMGAGPGVSDSSDDSGKSGKGNIDGNVDKSGLEGSSVGNGSSGMAGDAEGLGENTNPLAQQAMGAGLPGAMPADGETVQAGTSLGSGTNVGAKADDVDELPDPTFDEEDAELKEGELEEEVTEIIDPDKDKSKSSTPKDEEGNEGMPDDKLSDNGEGEGAGRGHGDGVDSQIAVGKSTPHIESIANEETVEDKDTNEEEEDVETVTSNEDLKVVYNMSTGTYEIIDMNKFLTDSTYVSENARLEVKDFSTYGGYATETKNDTEEEQKRGIVLYILAVIALLTGIGFGVYHKKKVN